MKPTAISMAEVDEVLRNGEPHWFLHWREAADPAIRWLAIIKTDQPMPPELKQKVNDFCKRFDPDLYSRDINVSADGTPVTIVWFAVTK